MKRILLLEDDPGLADGLSYSLEKNGFCVDTAGSISCAKEYISKIKILTACSYSMSCFPTARDLKYANTCADAVTMYRSYFSLRPTKK